MNKKSKSIIVSGVKTAAGYAASRIVSNVGFVAENPMFRVAAPFAGAFAVNQFLGAKGSEVVAGMIVGGVQNIVQEYAPDIAAKAGLSGVPYRSLVGPGVAGTRSYANRPPVRVVVQ